MPLEPHAGPTLARALVEHGFSAIFDLSLMNVTDQLDFVSSFAGELLRINHAPVHLFLDEAHIFAPQTPLLGGGRSEGAWVRLGKAGNSSAG